MSRNTFEKICYIVGAGDGAADFVPRAEDLVIAADAGFLKLAAEGIRTDVAIGDFDSLKTVPALPEVLTLPAEKDVTDTYAAVMLGIERGYTLFHIYCGTGGSFRHTYANIQCLTMLAGKGLRGYLFSDKEVVTAFTGALDFPADFRGFISVFAAGDAATVTETGLKYPLDGYPMTNSYPIGVSNEFTGRPACVTSRDGILIVVYDRQAENIFPCARVAE